MKKVLFILVLLFLFTPKVYAISLDSINQKVCDRFEEDLNKLAAIMEEERTRQGITETRVAFGGVDTKIESADYQITFAAEALAYQRAKEHSSPSQLKNNLQTLSNKILQAKLNVGRAIK